MRQPTEQDITVPRTKEQVMKRAMSVAFLVMIASARLMGQEVLTMQKAVATALELNQSLRGAQHEVASAGWGAKNAYSNFLPRVTLDAGVTRIDPETDRRANAAVDFIRSSAGMLGIPPSFLADLRPFSYRDTYGAGITVIQPVYNGGAEIVGVNAAGALEQKSEYSLDDTRQEVVARVRIAYLNVLSAQELVVLATEAMERTQRYLETTRRREELGMRTRTDVARWEVQLAADEGSLVRAKNLLASARLQLNDAMGVDLDKDYTLEPVATGDDTIGTPLAGTAQLFASLQETTAGARLSFADLETHPSWLMMNTNLRLAEIGIAKSWTAFQPRINVAFQYGWEKNNTLKLDGYRPWALALTVTFPIFNGFGDYTNLQRAHEDYQKTESQAEAFRRGLLMQATNAQLNVQAARQRIEAARKGQTQALDVLNSVTRRYESGGASNVDLLDAQTAYTSAKASFVTATYDYYIARVQLARATGTIAP
ncbi:MAG: TolC family protein [Bacteroidota bacterium]